MQRRSFLGMLAAFRAVSLADSTDLQLRIAVNRTTIESAPLLVENIPGVRIVPAASGRVASAQLVNGEVDAATGSETQALLNSVSQPDLRIVLTLSECRYRIVARRSAGIRNLTGLRGKRVASTKNTSAEYFLVEMLAAAGLKESEVTPFTMEGEAMPGSLAKKQVDAIAIWEPHAQNAIDILGADALILEDPSVYHERFNLNTTLRVLRDPAKRRTLVSAIKAMKGISAKLRISPGDLLPKLANAISTSESLIAKVWGQFHFPAELDELQLSSVLVPLERWAARSSQRQPRRKTMLAAIIDGSVLAEARNRT